MTDVPPIEDDEPDADVTQLADYEQKLTDIEIRERESAQFWRQVLAHPIGQREMWGILTDAHTFEERFRCGPNGFPQPDATWFHAGEQSFGLRLFLRWQLVAPDETLAMQREQDPRFQKPAPPKRRRRA